MVFCYTVWSVFRRAPSQVLQFLHRARKQLGFRGCVWQKILLITDLLQGGIQEEEHNNFERRGEWQQWVREWELNIDTLNHSFWLELTPQTTICPWRPWKDPGAPGGGDVWLEKYLPQCDSGADCHTGFPQKSKSGQLLTSNSTGWVSPLSTCKQVSCPGENTFWFLISQGISYRAQSDNANGQSVQIIQRKYFSSSQPSVRSMHFSLKLPGSR